MPLLIVRAFLTAQQKKAALWSHIHSSVGSLTLSPLSSLQFPPCLVPTTMAIVPRLACSQRHSQGLLDRPNPQTPPLQDAPRPFPSTHNGAEAWAYTWSPIGVGCRHVFLPVLSSFTKPGVSLPALPVSHSPSQCRCSTRPVIGCFATRGRLPIPAARACDAESHREAAMGARRRRVLQGASVWLQVCPASRWPLGLYVKVTCWAQPSPGALSSLALTSG